MYMIGGGDEKLRLDSIRRMRVSSCKKNMKGEKEQCSVLGDVRNRIQTLNQLRCCHH